MTRIALHREDVAANEMAFRAVAGHNQAMGRTAGEALDALTTQLPAEKADTLVIVRNLGPDRFFSAEQRQRLEHLMTRWRTARDEGQPLSEGEQAELDQLVEAEVRATADRAAALVRELAP